MTDFSKQFETNSAMDLSEIESDTDSEMPDLISESDYQPSEDDYEVIVNKLDYILEQLEIIKTDKIVYQKQKYNITTETFMNIIFYLYFTFFYFLN